MNDQTWFYIDSSQAQHGPISASELESLVASGTVTRETQVWTESLGDQWILARKVEGLFTEEIPPMGSTLRPPSHAASVPETDPYPLPSLAATTPMIPSTPTTQPVRGVQVPANHHLVQAAANDPYQPPASDPQPIETGIYPATIKKGGSMGLWSALFFGGILCIILGIIMSGVLSPTKEATPNETKILTGFSVAAIGYFCILFSAILIYIYLYRAWKCLQPGGATVSPGKAIGFLFIPFFNIYWFFIAFGSLPRQWNHITSSYSNTQNAPRLTMSAFICLLLIPVIGQIIWMIQITKALNFMLGLHFQQTRPVGGALAGLTSRANFK